jgi:hypothetical protein
MFEISVTREFEDWYQALDSQTAERVAAELNVLERLGPELDGTRSSRLLLWFDGMQNRSSNAPWGLREPDLALAQVLRSQHEALRCLETPNFLARFLKLEARQAQRGHELLERLRARVRAALQLSQLAWRHRLPASELPWAQPALTEQPSAQPDVQAALLEVLSLVGLRLEDVADRSSGLRELTVAELSPPQRLLYAVDAPRRRILVILGEALDRAYYGDSVRLAERRWRDYCRTLPISAGA